MALGSSRRNDQLVPNAHQALDDMKYEIAAEMGLPVYQGSEDYWGHITTRDAGAVGGHMVRKLIAFSQAALVQQTKS
ncbi:alpha/beta-type small acid-soluble spore protein [Tumebacillus permanentifrigoris]|uniref:Small acid-soluble spore protein A (Major alpha-type SASP) n=1 Tax=Tumebacillus permanentifrigoris TaxID=378543 RepID=A0A316DF73_9BACL|nr:alpha/beta-type small acid-soluble spore protein [Tumebacillus permanentifrigoris]PWK16212.1 small acid-soluble spore protein A (major alpha-type SASP) [Tumebacillus permanentifrigoris]